MMSDDKTQLDTISDEEFFAARRETMGADYPGDEAMRQFDREADVEFDQWQARENAKEPVAPEPETAAEFNAREWLAETFKDDPNFAKLSAEEHAQLEALATEKHAVITEDVTDWATEVGEEWSQKFQDSAIEGLESSPVLQEFAETRLADGEFSDEDKAALRDIAHDMDPKDAVEVIRPILETAHEFKGEIIDGAEMIIDHAVDDVRDIVEARAEMTGGDTPEVHALIEALDEAPERVDEVLNFERESDDYEWGKIEDRLDAISDGADPRSLHDTDTYQQDPNADICETADA